MKSPPGSPLWNTFKERVDAARRGVGAETSGAPASRAGSDNEDDLLDRVAVLEVTTESCVHHGFFLHSCVVHCKSGADPLLFVTLQLLLYEVQGPSGRTQGAPVYGKATQIEQVIDHKDHIVAKAISPLIHGISFDHPSKPAATAPTEGLDRDRTWSVASTQQSAFSLGNPRIPTEPGQNQLDPSVSKSSAPRSPFAFRSRESSPHLLPEDFSLGQCHGTVSPLLKATDHSVRSRAMSSLSATSESSSKHSSPVLGAQVPSQLSVIYY